MASLVGVGSDATRSGEPIATTCFGRLLTQKWTYSDERRHASGCVKVMPSMPVHVHFPLDVLIQKTYNRSYT